MGHGMIEQSHALWSRLTDWSAFTLINILQLRGAAGFHSGEDFERYVNQWVSCTISDYYQLPASPSFSDWPDSGPFSFPSPHPTGHAENDRVHIHIWPGPAGRHSPAMILLHGFMSVSDVGYRLWAKHLNRNGWTAVFFDLPYHYRRKPRGIVSGELALTSHFIHTAETIRQGVLDLRAVCQALREHGAPQVGCWATSYGGWMASLLCVVEPALTTALLVESVVDVDHCIFDSPACGVIRRQAIARGITRDLTRRHLPLVCPSHHTPVVNAENILLVAGRYDQITPPEVMKKLHSKWSGSHYAEIAQGHIGYQLMPASWNLAVQKLPPFSECKQ